MFEIELAIARFDEDIPAEIEAYFLRLINELDDSFVKYKKGIK